MIPERRIDAAVLTQRARFQKRLQATTWLLAAGFLGATLLIPLAPALVAAWWILAALAIGVLVIQILSLRKLGPHHEAANPPDPLKGRERKTVDFDKTWRESQ